jgi:hypothetical protein
VIGSHVVRPDGTLLLKKTTPTIWTPSIDFKGEHDDAFGAIRCPECHWHPDASSRWACVGSAGSPEPMFQGCGTSWNTFLTRGRCPSCAHQWHWTACLRCSGWSLHEDWYDAPERRRS